MDEYTVYKHTFPNGKIYIGITKMNPLTRWGNGHGYSGQKKIYEAIVKYGWENIRHEILYTGLSQREAFEKETELIERLDAIKNGYNVSRGGLKPRGGCKGAYKYKEGQIYGRFEIVGRNNHKILLRCLDCGRTIERDAGSLQKNNARCLCKTKRGTMIPYSGKTQTAKEWSNDLGIPAETILQRWIKGQPIDQPRQDTSWMTPKECPICKKTFTPAYKKQKFCSNKCCTDSLKAERPKAKCRYCGKEFQTTRCIDKHYKAMFCCIPCRVKWQQAQS
jgi:hypothetical protein